MTSEDTPHRIGVYTRISADPQGRAVGVHDQADQGRAFAGQRWPGAEITGPGCECKSCQRFGVPPDIYCDNDITASGKKRRPHYERLLADIAAGRITAVVTSDTDRLHRHPMELETYINVCEPRGVATHTIKKGEIDLTTSTGRMVARMLGAAARHEWERMVERQKNAKRRNRDAGLRQNSSRPFGFQHDERDATGAQIPGVSKGLIIDETEAAPLREAYRTVLGGDPSNGLSTITRKWNEAGLRTPRSPKRGGRPWTHAGVREALLNPANAGLIEHNGEIVGKAAWDPIVSVDTWRAVKAILTDPARKTGPGPKPRWLLTGALICGVCGGRRFSVTPASSRGAAIYRCVTLVHAPLADTSVKRFHLTRNVANLDAYIESIIVERLSRPDVVAALNTRPEVDIPALETRRKEIKAELDEIASLRFSYRQRAEMSAPLLDEDERIDKQIAEGLHGDPLPEFRGNDPAKVWAELKAAGDIGRMRAIVQMLMRVRLYPIRLGKRGPGWRVGDPWPFDYDSVEILPPDA